MIKRKFKTILVLAMVCMVGLIGCRQTPSQNMGGNPAATETPAPTTDPAATETPAPTTDPAAEQSQTTQGDTGAIAPITQVGGVLCLKVNPEIAISYDEAGNVTKLEAYNEAANSILASYTGYEGKSCKQVIAELVTAIGNAGYLVDEVDGSSRQVNIEIERGSILPNVAFMDEVVAEVRTCINNNKWTNPVEVFGESDYGMTDYVDTDYGPSNDGYTDYDDTDYGPNNDGVTDYNDTDYGPNNDGVTDYNDTDYGPNNDGVTDYNDGSSNYSDSGYSDSGYNNDSGYDD